MTNHTLANDNNKDSAVLGTITINYSVDTSKKEGY